MGIESISVKDSRQTHLCSICHFPLKKNGTTSKGTQRWRCTSCGASSTLTRADTTARNQLTAFVGWILSKQTQAEYATSSARTFRRHTAWCWNVHPTLPHTGEVFDEIQVDGIYLRKGWCALIAIANGKVIGCQWCDQEKSVAWLELLRPLAEPKVVVTDGGSGLLKALKELWPQVKVQRCLVHIQRNVRTQLTLKPKTTAGKALRALSLRLTRIKTRDEATAWIALFAAWHTEFQHYLNEKTYAKDFTGTRPKGIRSTRVWWYTHDRLRKAYSSMNTALKRGHLFTYLREDLHALGINATTNMIEGAINSGIRTMIFHHRGMPTEHRRAAVEWFCWQHTAKDSRTSLGALIRPEHYTPRARKQAAEDLVEEQIGPELYGTGTTAEEGLYARIGWGGRSASTH
ncbi:IS1249 family transposase [Arthrobacter sp. YC-RL1]|uniref:IS1249 family transposase n=1 Tax=Arthrobacter sp. YC-RL1 TaxID=1652545 RepID=UPI0009E36A67|nr:IS1249 family transposase [Arthrobacter sp. YC-RL1]